MALNNADRGTRIRMVETELTENENSTRLDFSQTTESQFLCELDGGVSKARDELKKKREVIVARSYRRLEEMKAMRKAFEQRKMEANELVDTKK